MTSPSTSVLPTFETNIEIAISKIWSDYIESELEQHRACIEGLNTLLPVAAFIAGVQAQIISLTITLPVSTLSRFANVLAFSGLVFEISGTAIGVLSTLVLRQKIKEATYFLSFNFLLKQRFRILWDNKDMYPNRPDPSSEEVRNIFEEFKKRMESRYPSLLDLDLRRDPLVSQRSSGYRYRSIFNSQLDLALSAMALQMAIPDGNQDLYYKVLQTPSLLIMFGAELLTISVILLAAAKGLSREVWITCTIVVAICICGPLFYILSGEQIFARKRQTNDMPLQTFESSFRSNRSFTGGNSNVKKC